MGGQEHEDLERILIEKNANAIPLSYTFLKYITNDFSDEREIGRGGFGIVYKGVLRNGNVAVKKLSRTDDFSDKQFKDELFCLISVKHKNIVRLLGYCSNVSREVVDLNGRNILADVEQRFLCFEYIANQTLKQYLEDESYGREWDTRYHLIEGICHGLQYLHNEQRINHLDLKPENILLDYGMVPKITDFGLSRRFGVDQSRILTQNIKGTLGYLAPEYLNNGKISFKSDIYSLGITIGKIIRGNNDFPDLKNWHTSQVIDSPQMKRCIEIAQRSRSSSMPSLVKVGESSNIRLHETNACNELLEFHPPKLQFHFEPNKLITCPLNLINRTDQRVAFMVYPYNPGMYFTEWLCGVVPPRSTYTLIVTMKEQQKPPPEGEFFIKYSSVTSEQLMDTSQREPEKEFKNFFTRVVKMGPEIMVHEQMLIAVCDPQAKTTSEAISTKEFDTLYSMDVHPTKPWIVTGHANGQVYIWDYQTKEKVNFFEATKNEEVFTVKFISREDWIVAGGGEDGYMYVYSCNTWEIVKKFMADNAQLTSFAIHPTETYLLSASYDYEIKLWDWGSGWNNVPKLKFGGHMGSVTQVVFNPEDAKYYASASKDGTIKIWNVDSTVANFTLKCKSQVKCLDYFSRGDGQYLITGLDDGTAQIWNLQTKELVETLKGHTARINAVCPHPDRPILLTGSADGTVRLWNSNSFRLQGILNFAMRKVYELACMKNVTRRVVIGHNNGLAIFRIDDFDDSSEADIRAI